MFRLLGNSSVHRHVREPKPRVEKDWPPDSRCRCGWGRSKKCGEKLGAFKALITAMLIALLVFNFWSILFTMPNDNNSSLASSRDNGRVSVTIESVEIRYRQCPCREIKTIIGSIIIFNLLLLKSFFMVTIDNERQDSNSEEDYGTNGRKKQAPSGSATVQFFFRIAHVPNSWCSTIGMLIAHDNGITVW